MSYTLILVVIFIVIDNYLDDMDDYVTIINITRLLVLMNAVAYDIARLMEYYRSF